MHTCCVHWLSVGHANDTLRLKLLTCIEWALWSLFYSDYLYGQAMVYCFIPFCFIALCLFHLHYKFFAHNDQVILLCFRRYLFLWFKSFTNFRVWCEWVLFNCSQLTWQVAKWCTRVKHAEKMNSHASWSTTGQKVQFGSCVCSWLELATQSSREAKSPANYVLKNLTLCIPFSP